MKRYILFSLCSSFALFDCDFDTQKAAKDFLSHSGDIEGGLLHTNFVLYDAKFDSVQYITVNHTHNNYIGNLYCSAWDSSRFFRKVYGVNI